MIIIIIIIIHYIYRALSIKCKNLKALYNKIMAMLIHNLKALHNKVVAKKLIHLYKNGR